MPYCYKFRGFNLKLFSLINNVKVKTKLLLLLLIPLAALSIFSIVVIKEELNKYRLSEKSRNVLI